MAFPQTTAAQDLKGIDEIAPFSEGLAAVRQGWKWGFINEESMLVINFEMMFIGTGMPIPIN